MDRAKALGHGGRFMLGLVIDRVRRSGSCVLGLGVALGLSGCELRLTDDEGYDDDYYYEGSSGGTPGGGWRYPESSPPDPPALPEIPDRDRPDAIAPTDERVYDGPGISTYVELLVLDPRVVGSKRAASSDSNAPWSFRTQMGWLAGGDDESLGFTVRWLDAWKNVSTVGAAPVTARPALADVLMRPWLGARTVSTIDDTQDATVTPDRGVAPDPDVTASQADDSATASYASDDGDDTSAPPYDGEAEAKPPAPPPDPYTSLPPATWSKSPFRLIAIVNRVDLAADDCGDAAGELRYVYTALGAEGSRALDLTVIVEIPYPSTRSPAGWARAWRDMADLPAGEEREAALLAITREVALEADPLRVRVRTNESALGSNGWQMREFELSSSSSGQLDLLPAPLVFTPRADADLGQLADYLLEHSDDVLGDGAELPESLRAGSAEMTSPDFSWRVPGVSERLRSAFSAATCNGCHAGDTDTPRFQHIAPAPSLSAPAELSRFLYDASAPTDELRRRTDRVSELYGASCPDDPPTSNGYY
jgi:hypothetical protein